MKEAAQGGGLKPLPPTAASRRPSTFVHLDSGSTLGGLPLLSPRSDTFSPSNMANGKRVASLGSNGAVDLLEENLVKCSDGMKRAVTGVCCD